MRVCTICARGGSKGLPGKNTMELLGKPLIERTIEHAMDSGLFDRIIVSTDDATVKGIAVKNGIEVVDRPPYLCTDGAGKIEAIAHAIGHLGCNYTTLVDLDVTSPLRLVSDITGAVELLESSKCSNVITGCKAHRSPYFNLVEVRDGIASLSKTSEVVCRQGCPPCFDMNASIYVWDFRKFRETPRLFYDDTKLYEMPRTRSVDIDDILDFHIVEMILKNRMAADSIRGFHG